MSWFSSAERGEHALQLHCGMNPRISSYADIEGHEGEARPDASAAPKEEHAGGGVALPTYHEEHPHRGAERVELGEPVDDVMDDGRIPVTPPAPVETPASPAPPTGADEKA